MTCGLRNCSLSNVVAWLFGSNISLILSRLHFIITKNKMNYHCINLQKTIAQKASKPLIIPIFRRTKVLCRTELLLDVDACIEISQLSYVDNWLFLSRDSLYYVLELTVSWDKTINRNRNRLC